MHAEHQDYKIRPASYAKNMIAISTTPDGSGMKTRAAYLATTLANGRYSNRERAYLMSKQKATQFVALYDQGFTATIMSGKIYHQNDELPD